MEQGAGEEPLTEDVAQPHQVSGAASLLLAQVVEEWLGGSEPVADAEAATLAMEEE